MSESTQLAVQQVPQSVVDALTAPAEPQQLLAIDPQRYVALVFEPFSEKLARYKTEADAVTFDVTTAAGMKTAIEWRARFRDEIRIASENARKERKAPILEIGRLLDSRAKELAKEVAPYEARFDDAIKAEEAKKEAARKAREEAERARIAEIQRRLVKLESLGSGELYTSEMAPERLQDILRQLEEPSVYDYAEFAEQATALRERAIVTIRQAHVEALERIERENAERAAREAEEQRIAAERAEQEHQEAERRAAEEARLRAAREAEEQRLAEVRRRLDAEQAEQRRVAQIQDRIRALSGPQHVTATDSPALIETAIRTLEAAPIDEEYAEFKDAAARTKEDGIGRLTALLEAARAHRAEQDRIASERAELERQQREQEAAAQAERDRIAAEERRLAEELAEIERREREQREAEERRQAEERAEAERQREARERAETLARAKEEARRVLGSLTAKAISEWIAHDLGLEIHEVAARIVEIPREDWLTLAMGSEAQERAA